MKRARLSFRLLGYWHAGSGEASAADLDAAVIRDTEGLPYLPGRSVKGLLREAFRLAEDFGRQPEGTTDRLFGREARPGDSAGSSPGLLRFTDARIDEPTRRWIASQHRMSEGLFDELSAVALDEGGLARNKQLRVIEVAVPAELHATVEMIEGELPEDLGLAVKLIRSLGSHRHRGLGRCTVKISPMGAAEEARP